MNFNIASIIALTGLIAAKTSSSASKSTASKSSSDSKSAATGEEDSQQSENGIVSVFGFLGAAVAVLANL